jgi:hypothetical protein
MNNPATNPNLPLSIRDPEAARQLCLSTHFLRQQDPRRAVNYARRPMQAGEPQATINLLHALMNERKYETAAEMAATVLAAQNVHHTVRRGVLSTVAGAMYHLGATAGNCSEAYGITHELTSESNLNPHLPHWVGQNLQGKTLLVALAEAALGGFGDHITWARFLPHLAATGARITIQTAPALSRLFSTIPGVVATCGIEDQPLCDYAVGVMEVPHILGLSGVPTANPFTVEPLPFPAETHNVAITWGASWGVPFFERSCALGQLLPLMQLPRTTLYSVQKSHHRNQLNPPPVGMQVHDLSPHIADFWGSARVLMSMDAVVTTDNVVANLACMLERPTFVLVPKASDWRWGEGGRAPWYPTARVYQQTVAGEWTEPIARLTSDLYEFLQTQARALPQPQPTEEPKSAESATPEAA